jgi:hypothetical protein
MDYKLEFEVIQVRKWSLRLVNISQTGYYGPILILTDYKTTGEKFKDNAGNITSIIYESPIKERLEWLRLKDMRELRQAPTEAKLPWSLFYYCRNMNLNPNPKKKKINLARYDADQLLLNYDTSKKSSLICFGDMEGIFTLQKPLDRKDIDYGKIKKLTN